MKSNLENNFNKEEIKSFFKKGGRVILKIPGMNTMEFNSGVPSMLINSVSQYLNKQKGNLSVNDAMIFYKAINKDLKEINYSTLKKWKIKNNLSFFGISQYNMLEYYLSFQN